MEDFILLFVTFSLVIIDFIVAFVYTEGIRSLLEKNRLWIYCLMFWAGILAIQTLLYSWLPGRIGAEINIFDGLFVLEDGALIRNLGYLVLAHAVAIVFALGKYLWNVARKKERFYGKMFMLQAAACCIFCFIGSMLAKSEYVYDYKGGENLGKAVMILLALAGGVFVFLGAKDARSERKKKGSSKSEQPASSTAPSKEALERFDQIVAEKNRLNEMGDYASQIPLLVEGTGLDVDAARKSRIWNYLGLAYRKIDSPAKELECFQMAARLAPENPSSYINLAVYYAEQEGDNEKAKKYLKLAKDRGGDEKAILSIQKRLESD